ncbi:MAG TPA: hypothetical protein PKA10_07980 [Selenomonadales bacterium]|nr:hypothetical protein [Selenomonadales bacterium]
MDDRDRASIIFQAKEGKPISRIAEEMDIDYWEVYCAAYGAGERSARGVKTMIYNRLKLGTVKKTEEKERLLSEVNDLVRHLYDRYQDNQQKLDQLRKVLAK